MPLPNFLSSIGQAGLTLARPFPSYLPPRPGDDDQSDGTVDPSVFMSDPSVGGISGQGPLFDPNSDAPPPQPTSSLPPRIQSRSPQADAPPADLDTTPPPPPVAPAIGTYNPPAMAPPQPNAMAGSESSALPSAPSIERAPPPPSPVGLPQGAREPNTSALPPKPGQGGPQLIPRSQAQFSAGMGVPKAPPAPPQFPNNPLVNSIQNTALNPSPLPKPPGTLRSILATLAASSAGGHAFAPLIAYGPKGLQQINQRQQQDAQLARQIAAAKVVDEEEKNQAAVADRSLVRTQQGINADETKRKDLQTEYDSQTNNIRGRTGYQLIAGDEVPDGYVKQTVTNPHSITETWVTPTAKQKKLEEDQAKHSSDVPLGNEIARALKITPGQKVPVESLPHYATAYISAMEKENPTLQFERGENQQTGDLTITGLDKKTGEQKSQVIIRGGALKKESADSGLAALDRKVAALARPYQTAYTNSTSQLDKILDAEKMVAGAGQSGAIGQALAIPKVLTALVSGQGTGVRITQAELNSIAKARGITGDIEGWINNLMGQGQLSTKQQQQLNGILSDVRDRLTKKIAIHKTALDEILGATDRQAAIEADRKGRQQLDDLEKQDIAGHPAVGQSFNGAKITAVKEISK